MRRPASNRFLALGRAGMDLYADPPGTPLEAGRNFFACLGGSSGNIAAGLARQGAEAALLSVVSDDAVGRFTLAALEAFGVATDHIRVVGGEHRTSLAVVDTLGDQTKAVIYRNDAADFALAPEDVDRVDFAAFGALVATGTALTRSPSREAVLRALGKAREAGAAVIIDLDYRRYNWRSIDEAAGVYAQAAALSDFVVGNDEEFAVLAGGDVAGGREAARALGAQDGRVVVYKMGAAGALTIAQGDAFETGVFEVDALKPTGAGDGFMAGFLCALAAGAELRTAVTRGSATAALVVSRVGCSAAMPTAAEVDALMTSGSIKQPG